jgi:hypothetical protein
MNERMRKPEAKGAAQAPTMVRLQKRLMPEQERIEDLEKNGFILA